MILNIKKSIQKQQIFYKKKMITNLANIFIYYYINILLSIMSIIKPILTRGSNINSNELYIFSLVNPNEQSTKLSLIHPDLLDSKTDNKDWFEFVSTWTNILPCINLCYDTKKIQLSN